MHRRYAILGTGAIGGYYGACLQKAGFDVHFLLRSDYEHVRQHGLVVESPDGDFVLPHVQAYPDVRQMPACEVVVVALKSTQNAYLSQLLPPLMADESVVLLLQNGLDGEEEVADIVGPHRVLGGLCFICANKVGPGHIRHLDYKAIAIGEYAPGYRPTGASERVEAIAQDFERADVPIKRTKDLLLARWQKLLWNIPFNGLSVVLDATTDEMVHQPEIRTLAKSLMIEVAAVAAAYHCPIESSYIEELIADTETMQPYRTSMKIDYDEKRPMEVDAIFRKPLKAAKRAGVDTPRLEMLYQQLQFLDEMNSRAKV